ncbi:hypothetical protein B0J17DRAFT_633860 [Rhizoctonia solani]|nr:hypothetical protein B0J17DRAFT_633860 [Rhizoctonia solani]
MCVHFHGNRRGGEPTDTMEPLAQLQYSHSPILKNDTDDWKPLKDWCSEYTSSPLFQWRIPSLSWWHKIFENGIINFGDDFNETVLSSIGTRYINKTQPLSQLRFSAAQLWLLPHLARVPSSIHQPSLDEVIQSELRDSLQLRTKTSEQVINDLEEFIIGNYRRDHQNNCCVVEDEDIPSFIWGRIKGNISSRWVESNTQPSPFSIGSGLKLLNKALQSDVKARSQEKNRTAIWH